MGGKSQEIVSQTSGISHQTPIQRHKRTVLINRIVNTSAFKTFNWQKANTANDGTNLGDIKNKISRMLKENV